MNTFLSSNQEDLKSSFKEFAKESLLPVAAALDTGSVSIAEFLKKLGEKGFLGLSVPSEYGGKGGSFLDSVLFVEAVSEYEPGLGLCLSAHFAVEELIKEYGGETQKSRYLPGLAQGESMGLMAISEMSAGTDFKAVETSAKEESAGYILTGKKTWVVNGGLPGVAVVLARVGEQDLGLFLVETARNDSLLVSGDRSKMGMKSTPTNDIEFKNVKIGQDATLCAGEGTVEKVMFGMNVAKTVVAASAVGLMEGALENAVEHANSREQFGKPIGKFQAVQWKLADLSTESTGARLMTYRAAWSRDNSPDEFGRLAAMAKLQAARSARNGSGEALQILGAAGLSTDSAVERFYRDAKTMEICQGTSEFQKNLLVEELDI